MNTVEIKGQDWPVRLDFGAMKRCLPLFGLKYVTDFDKMLERLSYDGEGDGEGVPAEAIAPFIQNVIKSGLRATSDDRPCPTEEDIEDGLNEDIGLYVKVIEGLAGEKKPAGKKKPRTTKQ